MAGTVAGEGFEQRAEAYRAELLAHCYRMVGSAHDAEDLVQDTYLRAWRAREDYDESRASLRTWLYRIATNVCLTALEGRARRPLPSGLVESRGAREPFVHGGEIAWLQPLPDSLLRQGDPAGSIAHGGGLRLAFVAALQLLSARERAVLILREVLAFSANESAEILGASTASVNSSLQRARVRLKEAGVEQEGVAEPSGAQQRAWVERYLKAFAEADVAGLVRLLTEDVLMEMPPMLNWFTGRENYAAFMGWFFGATAGTRWRLLPLEANGQQGFAAYGSTDDGRYELHTVQILTFTLDGISRTSVFQDDEVYASFGLAKTLEA
jgi:RNA polymerase sigma-70 factor, ECF subfamily